MIHNVTNLYIAYAVTWVIHIGYVLFLNAKAKKLRAGSPRACVPRRR